MCYHSSEYGGIEKQILDLIKELSDEINFIIVCPNGPLVEKYIAAGAKKHINLKPKSELDLGYVFKIAKICKKENIDIVHAHELLTGCLAMLGAYLAAVEKRIYHVHTSFLEWKHSGIKKYISLVPNFIANFLIGNFIATDVLALTDVLKHIRSTQEKINPQKITVIYNAVDLKLLAYNEAGAKEIRDRYLIPDYGFLIGNVSRFTEEKGQALLIEAFAAATANTEKYYLLLAGGGRLLSSCKELANELGIQDKVIFTDHFEEIDKPKLLSAMDLCVIPTYAEGFGIALIEAMANSRPILASDIPVLKEVAKDSVSYFRAGDFSDLVSKLDKIEKTDLILLQEKALARAQNFSMKNFAQAYQNLYLK
jgi:glycosyltransferase involved in cell wall biosynthesis